MVIESAMKTRSSPTKSNTIRAASSSANKESNTKSYSATNTHKDVPATSQAASNNLKDGNNTAAVDDDTKMIMLQMEQAGAVIQQFENTYKTKPDRM